MGDKPSLDLNCPLPVDSAEVQLDHGGGGQLSQQLLDRVILPRFASGDPENAHDSAPLDLADSRIAFTTDSYVINPLIFPGGDIGKLAICGTVNDLLMAGARPRFLSCSLIIEEGLSIVTLETILDSMAKAAAGCGVTVVTGDTKVVERGCGDGLYINTAGIGFRHWPGPISPRSIRTGDAVILSGDIGRHGLAVLAQREGLRFDTPIVSDCASLLPAVAALLGGGIEVHCLRDATRGGLASILVELAEAGGRAIEVEQGEIPLSDDVAGGCELLGLDPLYVANEGCFVAMVPAAQAEEAVRLLRGQAVSHNAAVIGVVGETGAGVTLRTTVGSRRVLRRMTGQPLPRIC